MASIRIMPVSFYEDRPRKLESEPVFKYRDIFEIHRTFLDGNVSQVKIKALKTGVKAKPDGSELAPGETTEIFREELSDSARAEGAVATYSFKFTRDVLFGKSQECNCIIY